jgi:hypothetical protein
LAFRAKENVTDPETPTSSLPPGLRVFTRAWRAATAEERVGLILHKTAAAVPAAEPVEGKDRTLRYCISSDQIDRYGDVIIQEGIDTSDYHNVVLWGHDSGGGFFGGVPMPPIGKSLGIETRKTGARTLTFSDDQFAGLDEGYEFADTVYKLAKAGFIPDCSIGLMPGETTMDPKSGAYTFATSKMLEHSLVPIGANTDATQMRSYAKEHGINLVPLLKWAEQTLDMVKGEAGVWIPKARLERFVKTVGFNRGLAIFDLGAGDLEAVVKARLGARPAVAVSVNVERGAIAYKKTPLAGKDEVWDAGEETKKAEVSDLKEMCCAFLGDGENKGDYKLPHHKGDGEHACVFRGVTAASGRLDQTDGIDKAAAKAHLEKHYHDFGEKAPWEKDEKSATSEPAAPAAANPDAEFFKLFNIPSESPSETPAVEEAFSAEQIKAVMLEALASCENSLGA